MRNLERAVHSRRINQRVLSLYFTMCCILIVVVEFTSVSKGHSILTTHVTAIKRTLNCSLVSMIHKLLLNQQQRSNHSPRCCSLQINDDILLLTFSFRATQPDQIQPAWLHLWLQPQQIQHHQQDSPYHAQLLWGQQWEEMPVTPVLGENHHRP